MAFSLHEKNGITWTESDVLPVKHMFTQKLGDVGDYPYSSNYDPVWLAPERQQKVREIWQNIKLAGDYPEAGIAFTHQIHGVLVRDVGEEDRKWPPLSQVPEDCDGLITTASEVPLCIFTADCVPVLLADAKAKVVCAVHSGWKGTVQDMMGSAVKAMLQKGAELSNICVAIGPCASACCFEVGPEVKEAIEKLMGSEVQGLCVPEAGVEGKFMADLKETNRRRLLQLGILPEHIDVSPDCTICKSDVYWSHRATKGIRGTQASIISL